MMTKLSPGHFSGEAVKTSKVANLVLVESSYQTKLRLNKHSHENACFCLVLGGSFAEIYGRKERFCQTSTLLFRPSDEYHLNTFSDNGARCFNIEIEPFLLEKLNQYAKVENESIKINDQTMISRAFRLYSEFCLMDEVSRLAIEGLSLEMLASLSRYLINESSSSPPRWLVKVKEILHEQFSENLGIDDLSAAVGVHPVHLSRSFRRYFQCTVADYVRHLRVEFACRRLSQTNIPLSQIAFEAGFAHQSHFSLIFKRQMNLTPAQYRVNFRSR